MESEVCVNITSCSSSRNRNRHLPNQV